MMSMPYVVRLRSHWCCIFLVNPLLYRPNKWFSFIFSRWGTCAMNTYTSLTRSHTTNSTLTPHGFQLCRCYLFLLLFLKDMENCSCRSWIKLDFRLMKTPMIYKKKVKDFMTWRFWRKSSALDKKYYFIIIQEWS